MIRSSPFAILPAARTPQALLAVTSGSILGLPPSSDDANTKRRLPLPIKDEKMSTVFSVSGFCAMNEMGT